jgi:hypothetical protein
VSRAWYEIVVGNLGTVWSEEADEFNETRVAHEYNDWITESKRPFGRAAGEAVTLFKDGEIYKEYLPEENPDEPV